MWQNDELRVKFSFGKLSSSYKFNKYDNVFNLHLTLSSH